MISKKTTPEDTPGGIIDLWEPTAVHELTDQHAISVLGAELRVRDCRPAERGGDFFILEATKTEDPPHGGTATGLVVVEVDRNRTVPARIIGDGTPAHAPDHDGSHPHHCAPTSTWTL
ncbi:hypothetical protein [Actinomadura roseirufa]|uniref:hypothetical protein n=1 Tax=Actinomadura roseirufa TaxID=2094049 RepID=UPI001041263A|nr:hypothetical protein [Actinomadura roseirufa]